MTIEKTTYIRKPFEVEAVQVTADNIHEVREWCDGNIEADHDQFIRVRVGRALNERQTKAYPGDWVLYALNGFKVYTSKAFYKTFELKNKLVIENDSDELAHAPTPEDVENQHLTLGNVSGATPAVVNKTAVGPDGE